MGKIRAWLKKYWGVLIGITMGLVALNYYEGIVLVLSQDDMAVYNQVLAFLFISLSVSWSAYKLYNYFHLKETLLEKIIKMFKQSKKN